jgi:hypothetical protein
MTGECGRAGGGANAQQVPANEIRDGHAALDRLLGGAVAVEIAVAFVSVDGARLLIDLLERHAVPDTALIARGAPVTDPDALVRLRAAGIAVAVVTGPDARRFHPKLWLARAQGELRVLSGSGNLTHGGLRENREQFELVRVPAPSVVADVHERRFVELTAGAMSLDEVEGSAAWREWHWQLKHRRRLADEQRRLDERLAATAPVDRAADKQLLQADLEDLYRRTVAAGLRRRDGQRYVPHRFREGIERARERRDPVSLVGRICHRQTEGFDVLLEADRPELTVEALVVDPAKPYHDIFSPETRSRSEERLRQFPSW